MLRGELADAKKALAAKTSDAAASRQLEELEAAVQKERARSAELDSALDEQRSAVVKLNDAVAKLKDELAAAKSAADKRNADTQ